MLLSIEPSAVKTVFLYIRQSTDERSGKQVRSLNDQKHDCDELAARLGLKIVDVFREDQSAKTPGQRPVFKAMVKELAYKNPARRRAEGILAWHPDRISRNALESGQILQMIDDDLIKGMFFPAYHYHNDPSGNEHLAIEFARAKGYTDRLSVAVLRGSTGREKEGAQVYGRAKFGYLKRREVPENPKLCSLFPIPCPRTFPIITKVFELRRKGASVETISGQLSEEGVEQRYSRSQISAWIRDPFYYGHWVINEGAADQRDVDLRQIRLPDGLTFRPVITEEQYWSCQRFVSKGRPRRKQIRHVHPIHASVICGDCDRSMRPAIRKIKKAGGLIEQQHGFECHTKHADGTRCGQKRIRSEILFTHITEALERVTVDKKSYARFLIGLEAFLKTKKETLRRQRIGATAAVKTLTADKAKMLHQKAALAERGALENDDKAHYKDALATLNQNLEKAEFRSSELNQKVQSQLIGYRKFIELSQNLHQDWISADHAQKRAISEKIVLNLTIESAAVRSQTWKKPFQEWLEGPEFRIGGAIDTKVEPWFDRLWSAYSRKQGVQKVGEN